MRNHKCVFCDRVFNDKHKYCDHIALQHNDQIPDEYDGLEFAYSLMVNKPVGRKCTQCQTNHVHFNNDTLKYERLCDNPKCKEQYVAMMKSRMVKVYGKEHLLNDADMQRKMIFNHADAHDYVWDPAGKFKFRVIGTYEVDFLNHLKSKGWSPADIICPSPNNYWYKWSDGSTHLYIPDFYIPSLSLEVEIKQGNWSGSFMEHNREIEALKDKRMKYEMAKTKINYIKIMDKNYTEFDEDYINSDNNNPQQEE